MQWITTSSPGFQRAGGGSSVASSAPINPQTTTQVTVDFTQGDYTVGATKPGGSEAAQATPSSIRSATLHIGAQRPNSNGALLQP